MPRQEKAESATSSQRATLDSFRAGPLAPYLVGAPAVEVGSGSLPEAGQGLVFSGYQLQDIGDYRRAIQGWFAPLALGGHLVIAVPHAFLHDRQNSLPSRWNALAKRLYTPASLMAEVEEALAPNSYRVRYLSDADQGYDYDLSRNAPPTGRHDVVLVLEKIAAPHWGLYDDFAAERPAPRDLFEPDRTRIERVATMPAQRILALKLDHLGDFIMGLPALHKLRRAFPDADITLVVGSWNETLAREAGVADQILVFDAYPRNSSEEAVDVPGKKGIFDALVTGEYDIAIDLRTDSDTRLFLRDVRAPLKAGLGSRVHHPWLNIFLPADITRHHHETAWSDIIPLHQFAAQGFCGRTHYQVWCTGKRARNDGGAIVWGPYRKLQPGTYAFEPFLEVDAKTPGLLGWDVALNVDRAAYGVVSGPEHIRAVFRVEKPDTDFEFRFWMIDDEPVPNFRFYGGKLMKQGPESVLHQSEYLALLVELVSMRVKDAGVFAEHGER